MKQITFDIVTINFNGGRFLSETIQSVLCQNYDGYRLLVQDGNSNDNSLHILNEFCLADNRIIVNSEEDAGPADALNKAFKRVNADYVLFLNSDDLLLPSSLARISKIIKAAPTSDILIGSGNLIDQFGGIIRDYYPFKFSPFRYAYGISVPMHPATIFRVDFLKRNSIIFNKLNMTCWDGEFIVECSYYSPKITYTDEKIASFRLHPNSISSNLRKSNYKNDQESIFKKIRGRPFRYYDHFLGFILRIIFLGFSRLSRKVNKSND